MPLYAYLHIPAIVNSESTDESYGNKWIPLTSVSLSSGTNEDDTEYTIAENRKQNAIKAKIERKKAEFKLAKDEAKYKKTAEGVFFAAFNEDFFDDLIPPPPPPAPVQPDDHKRRSDDDDEPFEKQSSGGTLEVSKMLDATSPKIHLLCLQCLQYESDTYMKGKIELHICRQIPGEKDKASREIYMAYILENCLLTNISVDASEYSKLTESITITFEKICSCIKRTDDTWDSKGWDFTEQKEVTGTIPTKPESI